MLAVCDQVELYLEDLAAPLWWPGLAERLVQESGISSDGYSTSRWFASASPTKVWRVACLGVVDLELSVELLPAPIAQRLSPDGASFADAATIATRSLDGLERALSLLQQVPTLAATVGSLTKSVHVLEPTQPGFDISFSDPSLPFSVFLNISQGQFADLRTAEALVHETMHLQLSLIERLVPIATVDQGLHYSPWKRTQRPVTGLVHALYVFRVIDQWLAHLPKTSDETKKYAQKRRQEIGDEIKQLAPSSFVDHLTVEGQLLLGRLLA